MRTRVGAVLALAALATIASAAEPATPRPRLSIGDPAPPLAVEKWLRGAPVTRFERGTVYVLDFWAVWCAPCLSGMAHTSDLADRFRDRGVRVVSLTGPDTAGNTLEAVERTLSRRGSTMRFDVAWDQASPEGTAPFGDVLLGRTTVRYFQDAQFEGLPHALIVDRQGRLAWAGLPSALEAPLTAIVEGRWDLKEAARRDRAWREAEPQVEEFRRRLLAGRFDDAYALARSLVRGPLADQPGYLRVIASTIVGERTTWAVRDVDLALEAAERAATLTGGRDDTVLSALARACFVKGDIERAIATQEAALALMDPPIPSQTAALEAYRRARAR